MEAANIQFLEDNRRHLDTIKHGAIKKVDVQAFRKVMIKEFNPRYGPVSEESFDQVAKLITDAFRHFDKWISEQPKSIT